MWLSSIETMRFWAVVVALIFYHASAQDPCKLCVNGGSVPTPDKLLDILPDPTLSNVTCKDMEELAVDVFQANTTQCSQLQSFGTLCGCVHGDGACLLCQDGVAVSNEYKGVPVRLSEFDSFFHQEDTEDFSPTCELVEGVLHSTSSEDPFCLYAQLVAGPICGCQPIEVDSTSSASTGLEVDRSKSPRPANGKSVELARTLQRSGSIISLIAALLVIQDNLRNKKKRKHLYNQIVTVMATFDAIASFSRAFFGFFRKSFQEQIADRGGPEAVCIAQGWLIQWSQSTSLFLNASLSTYYFLVIVKCCTNEKLKALRKYIFGFPLIIGLVLAFAALPYINYGIVCFIAPPLREEWFKKIGLIDDVFGWGPTIGLVVVPIYVVLVYATVAMVRVYAYVRKTDQSSERWNIRSDSNLSLPTATSESVPATEQGRRLLGRLWGIRRIFSCRLSSSNRSRSATSKLRSIVAWQCLWYLLALYITWGLYATFKITAEGRSHEPTWFNNPLVFVVPLQGFFNACVYFRPRAARRWSKFLARRKERHSASREERPDITPARSEVGIAENTSGSHSSHWGRLGIPACSGGCYDATDRYHDVDEPAVDLVAVNSQMDHEPSPTVCDVATPMEGNENLAYLGNSEIQDTDLNVETGSTTVEAKAQTSIDALEVQIIEDLTEGAAGAAEYKAPGGVTLTSCC